MATPNWMVAWTMSRLAMFGSTCSSVMRNVPLPEAGAEPMGGRLRRERVRDVDSGRRLRRADQRDKGDEDDDCGKSGAECQAGVAENAAPALPAGQSIRGKAHARLRRRGSIAKYSR